MIFQANGRKSRTQWAKELKGTEYKTFTHPTGCKRGHEKLFSVSEEGKCVECVRLKDQKRYAKKLGVTVEELEEQRAETQRQREERQARRIADRVADREAKRLAKLAKAKADREAKELRKAEAEERQWWMTKGWRLERRIHREEVKAQPQYAHVYAITNTVNGKTYIGSSGNIKSRLASHQSGIKHGNHHVSEIVADAEKYGPEAFNIEIISTLLPDSKEERLAIERHYIETWDGDLYNKHYHPENYGGREDIRADHMARAVANIA